MKYCFCYQQLEMSAKFQTVLLKADVTAVKIVGDLILAGKTYNFYKK